MHWKWGLYIYLRNFLGEYCQGCVIHNAGIYFYHRPVKRKRNMVGDGRLEWYLNLFFSLYHRRISLVTPINMSENRKSVDLPRVPTQVLFQVVSLFSFCYVFLTWTLGARSQESLTCINWIYTPSRWQEVQRTSSNTNSYLDKTKENNWGRRIFSFTSHFTSFNSIHFTNRKFWRK